MALIDIPQIPSPPTPPPPPTKEEIQADEAVHIKAAINAVVKQIFSTFQHVYVRCWNNPRGLTPQEWFDALGTDAVQLLAVSNGIQQLLNNLSPGAMDFSSPEGVTLVPNENGTVTVQSS